MPGNENKLLDLFALVKNNMIQKHTNNNLCLKSLSFYSTLCSGATSSLIRVRGSPPPRSRLKTIKKKDSYYIC